MLQFFSWYIVITILGLLTFPLAYRLLPALPDQGYAFSRALGLLIWAFVFWLAVSLGLSQNNIGGLVLALVVLVGLSLWANWRVDDEQETVDREKPAQPSTFNLQPILAWFKPNLRYVVSVETLFFLAFAVLAFIRANNPDLIGTEKPMEMAFINAIIHSPTFPPHDPWLSGYAISYYYFGYVMTAMMAEITSTVGNVAFNLMLSLVFSLSAIGAYGLLYNLLSSYQAMENKATLPKAPNPPSLLGAFLAPLFLLVLGNWEALLEVFHKRGIGWSANPDGTFGPTGPFWTWLGIVDLKDVPHPVAGAIFDRLSFWWSSEGFNGLGKWFTEAFIPNRVWWWRASRVVTDYDLEGALREVIDEFPAFSFLLGDLHPHILAMPFALLIGALALNLYLGGWMGETHLFKLKLPNGSEFEMKFPVRLEGFILLAVALGGIAFLNTWSFPIYLGLVSSALIFMLVRERGWKWNLIEEFLKFSIPLALLSVVLYLPFYMGFSSQASGILPNVIFPTRASHLWIMFGGLFLPIFALLYLWRKKNADWKKGFSLALGVVALLGVFSTLLTIFGGNSETTRQFATSRGLLPVWDVLWEAFLLRLAYGGGLLTMVLLIGGAVAYLTVTSHPRGAKPQVIIKDEAKSSDNRIDSLPFVWIMILFGGLLVLVPDFIFLRDQFGYRINTLFKFYYEAWTLWAIAAAFASAVLLNELRGWTSTAFTTMVIILVGIGLIYPVLGILTKTNHFKASFPQQDPTTGQLLPAQLTLDGAAHLQYKPDEYAAIQFLSQAAPGTVAEAAKPESSYSEFARVSTYSGLPTVLGWDGHENQWRGGEKEMGTRNRDIETLYATRDWGRAQAILEQYRIRYIYIGHLERQTFPVYEDKFAKNLSPVFQQGQVVIYVMP